MGPLAGGKGLEMKIEPAPGTVRIRSDRARVRQILLNLLGNAIKFTKQGTVTVDCQRVDDQPHLLRVDVTDTGVGIAKEHQSRIFERFFRVDKARSREVGGTGLGLSIVKHFCQMFGGTVSVSSQIGRGSTFSVRLKRALSSAVL